MTPEEAKAALNLCPPGDETNPDVPGMGAALELVGSNPQLAAWWEEEKNFTGQFSRKLAALTPPGELSATIMRGGATIFFASRLIAESTGETLPELPTLADEPDPKKTAVDELAAALKPKYEPAPRSSFTWLWRAAVLSVVTLVIVLLAMLLVFPAFTKVRGGHQLFILISHFARPLAGVAPPPSPPGQTLADLQKIVAAAHAPNPPDPLGRAPNGANAVPVFVSTDGWESHPVTHYVLQSGQDQADLFILNQSEFPYDEIPPGITEPDLDNSNDPGMKSFHVQIWGADGFIYVELTTPAIKSP